VLGSRRLHENGHPEIAVLLPLGWHGGGPHGDPNSLAFKLRGHVLHARLDRLEGEVGMEVQRELEVVRAPGHVGDPRSDEAGNVRHGLDRFNLDTEQDSFVPPGRVLAPSSRSSAGSKAESVGTAPAPPPERAVVGEIEASWTVADSITSG